MNGFEGHPGTQKLAAVLSGRMKKEVDSPLVLDFGEIQSNQSLLTNTFPIPIPKGDYTVCRHISGLTYTADKGEHPGHKDQTETHNNGSHTHIIKPPGLKPGDRVLVAWVQNEACVIDVIIS